MKKAIFFLFIAVAFFSLSLGDAQAKKSEKNTCSTIQSGEVLASDGSVINIGFDQWGYNYQGKMFRGFYDNSSRPEVPVEEGDKLIMKWNDAWLSNKDCDGDNQLDRHYGYDSYLGSGAWLTNHQSGVYEEDGEECSWNYFIKIVAAPLDAYVEDGVYYTAGGEEIGEAIWGAFAIIQEVSNDSCTGEHGAQYHSPVRAGLGNW